MLQEIRDPTAPDAVVTKITERHGCLYVTGRVRRNGETLDAEFVVPQGDVQHLSRDAFHAYARRRLPDFTLDHDWMAEVMTV